VVSKRHLEFGMKPSAFKKWCLIRNEPWEA
jgi:hypothetical protein